MNNLVARNQCPLCASANLRAHWRRDGWTTTQCADCTLVFVNPVLPEAEYHAIYNQDYLSSPEAAAGLSDPLRYRDYERERSVEIFDTQYYQRYIAPYLGQNPGAVFDIGCANGNFLECMKRHGWQIAGQEVNLDAARLAADRLGAPIHAGSLSTLRTGGHFDLVTLWDVVEHLYNPMLDLRLAAELCKPGGHIIVETVNVDDQLVRWWYRSRWQHFHPRVHLIYWSTTTLALALTKLGFEIVATITYPSTGGVGHVLQRRWFDAKRAAKWIVKCLLHRLGYRRGEGSPPRRPTKNSGQFLYADDQTIIARKLPLPQRTEAA